MKRSQKLFLLIVYIFTGNLLTSVNLDKMGFTEYQNIVKTFCNYILTIIKQYLICFAIHIHFFVEHASFHRLAVPLVEYYCSLGNSTVEVELLNILYCTVK